MRLSGTFRWMVASIALVALLSALPAQAASTQTPDPKANEMLANFIKEGAKAFYMGTKAGLDGWLLIKDGKSQVAYAPTGTQYLLVGMLFQPDGGNLTYEQVKEVTKQNPEIATLLPQKPPLEAPPSSAAPAAAAGTGANMSQAPATAPQPGLGDKLVKDLLAASGVTLGSSSAPQLLMVMDPDCKHCRATWGYLRDAVLKGTLQVHMIPIGTQDTNSERAAAIFLHKDDPLSAWDKYYNGDASQLAGTPDQASIGSVRANHKLIDSWNIDTTPLLAYRSRSGEVKIIKGEPQQPLSTIIADMVAP